MGADVDDEGRVVGEPGVDVCRGDAGEGEGRAGGIGCAVEAGGEGHVGHGGVGGADGDGGEGCRREASGEDVAGAESIGNGLSKGVDIGLVVSVCGEGDGLGGGVCSRAEKVHRGGGKIERRNQLIP